MTFGAFPKIWALGTPQTARLLIGPVEVTEKLDGSQFCFRYTEDGELLMRSKGATLQESTEDALFKPVVQHIIQCREAGVLPKGVTFWGETLCKPRHNILKYDQAPKGHLALFAACDSRGYFTHTELTLWASNLGVDIVPLIHEGEIPQEEILTFVKNAIDQRYSFLGGQKIEGVVIKNYAEQLLIGGLLLPVLAAKYVSEAFKEQHKREWVTTGDILRDMMLSYKTTARWKKAIQHLRERGELTHSPKDIGPLLKELNLDFEAEMKEDVQERLYNHYRKDFLKVLTGGFPEWYKEQLVLSLAEAA